MEGSWSAFYAQIPTHASIFWEFLLPIIYPTRKKYPHCFVANTDPHYRKGQHWVSIWVQNSHSAEYFCSLGEPPNARFQQYLSAFQSVKVNNRQIQANLEDTCGHYCIYFLICRAQGQSFPQIMQTLWRTRAMADMLVKFFVRNLIGRH
jgi:hypothetical protein